MTVFWAKWDTKCDQRFNDMHWFDCLPRVTQPQTNFLSHPKYAVCFMTTTLKNVEKELSQSSKTTRATRRKNNNQLENTPNSNERKKYKWNGKGKKSQNFTRRHRHNILHRHIPHILFQWHKKIYGKYMSNKATLRMRTNSARQSTIPQRMKKKIEEKTHKHTHPTFMKYSERLIAPTMWKTTEKKTTTKTFILHCNIDFARILFDATQILPRSHWKLLLH